MRNLSKAVASLGLAAFTLAFICGIGVTVGYIVRIFPLFVVVASTLLLVLIALAMAFYERFFL